MRVSLPATGRPKESVLAEMREMKTKDIDWQHGRSPLFVFKATDELYEVGRDAYFEFFAENALGAKRAFQSIDRMQNDVVAMALGIFNAPESAQGFMTTGGTESIVQAMQACRDWSRKQRKEPALRGNIVADRKSVV